MSGELRTPDLPGFDGRERDKLSPLATVAALAGPDYVARLVDAARALRQTDGEELLHLELIEDLAHVLGEYPNGPPAAVHTQSLLLRLNALEDSPWSDLGRDGLTGNRLRRLLGHFGIRPEREPFRLDPGDAYAPRRRGYRTAPVLAAFETYGRREHTSHT